MPQYRCARCESLNFALYPPPDDVCSDCYAWVWFTRIMASCFFIIASWTALAIFVWVN